MRECFSFLQTSNLATRSFINSEISQVCSLSTVLTNQKRQNIDLFQQHSSILVCFQGTKRLFSGIFAK